MAGVLTREMTNARRDSGFLDKQNSRVLQVAPGTAAIRQERTPNARFTPEEICSP